MSAPAVGRWILAATGVAIVGAVIGAVAVMGTPGAQRDLRLDARRVSDLGRIETAVDRHYREHRTLPAELAVINARPGVALDIADPVTGAPYRYRTTGNRSYRICARFVTDTARHRDDDVPDTAGDAWAHGVGETCFDRRIEKQPKGDVADVLGP